MKRTDIAVVLTTLGVATLHAFAHDAGRPAEQGRVAPTEPDSAPIKPAATGIAKPAAAGVLAFAILLGVYFGLVTLVSGREFALEQFFSYWYFLVGLAAGFGAQIGLYSYLKRLVGPPAASKKVVAVSGTTSTAAMISCCAHYLTNVLPVLGATGLVTIAAQYQVQFFWVGLVFNAAGILYIAPKVFKARKEHAQCANPL
jgi:Cu+-exporting ATPase